MSNVGTDLFTHRHQSRLNLSLSLQTHGVRRRMRRRVRRRGTQGFGGFPRFDDFPPSAPSSPAEYPRVLLSSCQHDGEHDHSWAETWTGTRTGRGPGPSTSIVNILASRSRSSSSSSELPHRLLYLSVKDSRLEVLPLIQDNNEVTIRDSLQKENVDFHHLLTSFILKGR